MKSDETKTSMILYYLCKARSGESCQIFWKIRLNIFHLIIISLVVVMRTSAVLLYHKLLILIQNIRFSILLKLPFRSFSYSKISIFLSQAQKYWILVTFATLLDQWNQMFYDTVRSNQYYNSYTSKWSLPLIISNYF